MTQGLNKVLLIGNLGQTPELKYTGGGTAYLQISLATNERWKDRDGEWKDRTEWHRVVVWNKRAEGLAKVLQKGSPIFVEGKIQTRSWEKNGEKKYATEIIAREVILLGSKGGGRGGPPPPSDDDYQGGGGYRGGSSGGGDQGDFGDEDVPF